MSKIELKEMINLPIFRAKKLDSDEYVFGVPRQDSKGVYEMIIDVVEDGISGVIQRYIEVDTISIHFPNMLDSTGNKIFASLQEDGKGGDIFQSLHFIEPIDKKHYLYHIAKWSNKYNSFLLCNKDNLLSNDVEDGNVFYWRYLINVEYEIIGIQQ